MSYDEFKEFYDKHPDLDNAEYYAEFENTNKSTVRSWKSRAWRENNPEPELEQTDNTDYTELENEHIKLLIQQANIDPKELEGLDNKSKILILKNKIKLQAAEPKKRGATGAILPQPLPSSKTKKAFGLDEFIEFDKEKGEIRMQIPMDHILDPEKNKKLGLLNN